MSRDLTDESAECALLSLCFAAPKELDRKEFKAGLFTGEQRALAKVMLELWAGAKPVSPANVRLVSRDEKLGELADKLNVRTLPGSFELLVERLREIRIRVKLANHCSKYHEQAYDEKRPIREIVEDFEGDAMALRGLRSVNQESGSDYNEILELIQWRQDNPGKILGLPTGWDRVDKMIDGLQGKYYLLGARTSVGKTSLALCLVASLLAMGKRVLFFAGENGRDIKMRLLSIISRVHCGRRDFPFTPEEGKAVSATIAKIQRFDWILDDTPNPSIAYIRGTARRLHRERRVDLVVVDFVQLCTATHARRDDKRAVVDEVSKGLKAAVKEHDFETAWLALSQVKRKEGIFDHKSKTKEQARPELSDLKEAGSLEEDADVVGLLHRDQANNSLRAELNIAKNKDGATGTIFMQFVPEHFYFSEST